MKITPQMLRDLECAVARDAVASLVITPDDYYIEVTWNGGRFLRREKWERVEYGISKEEAYRAARDWASLISLFVDPEAYSAEACRLGDPGRFGANHDWSHRTIRGE